jgi:hypothetical protein
MLPGHLGSGFIVAGPEERGNKDGASRQAPIGLTVLTLRFPNYLSDLSANGELCLLWPFLRQGGTIIIINSTGPRQGEQGWRRYN